MIKWLAHQMKKFIIGFHVQISQNHMEHDSIIGDSSHMRQMPGHRHDNLRSVEITGFYSAKSLIELTCYILDNTVALKYLTLDTTRGFFSCSTGEHDRCFPMDKIMITEANRAVLAIQNIHRAKSSFHGQAKCCEALQPLPCCWIIFVIIIFLQLNFLGNSVILKCPVLSLLNYSLELSNR